LARESAMALLELIELMDTGLIASNWKKLMKVEKN
jgi:hypothetical protein